MLGRLILGSGVTASALLASQVTVADAATKDDKSHSKPVFAPVYDDETTDVEAPLPGTVAPSKPVNDSKLAETESKVNAQLDVAQSKLQTYIDQLQGRLESYTGQARRFLDQKLRSLENATQIYDHKYREGERNAAEIVASLKSDNEEMLPQSIYILVSGLSGSIVARRHNFLVRLVTPWVFGIAAFRYFLPETFGNTRSLLWRFEQQQLPTLAQKHSEAHENAGKLKTQTVQLYQQSEKQFESSVRSVRQTIKEWTGY